MVMRLLTVRAVQQVLVQLQEVNQAQAQWLNHFAADNQPSEAGFLLKLLSEQGKDVVDPITRSSHTIDPQALAHRILQVRGTMAADLASGFAEFASLENTAVLRSHLTKTVYTSGFSGSTGGPGTAQERPDYRRGYKRTRPPHGV